jgi:D-xylose 1-dehydrogenase
MPNVHRAHYPSLEGHSIFVTGGASGIGAAMVRAFAGQKALVTFVDINEKAGTEHRNAISAAGLPTPLFIRCDLRDVAALRTALITAGKTNGPVATLVNNAADDTRHKLADLTPAFWDERFAINLRPMVFAAQEAAKQMRERGGGSIINIGSHSWKIGIGGYVGYEAAKSAVHGLTRALARELGPDMIRVNTVSPGWTMTERQLKMWVTPAGEAQMDRDQFLKVRLQPEDIASMVLFLAADDSRYCTASDYCVDAGWT